ncbi:MAG: ABC transporter permease [Desertimonas sp.]
MTASVASTRVRPLTAPRAVVDAPLVRTLALLVGLGAALPVGYLVVRASDLGAAESWRILSSARTRELLANTAVLVVAVSAASTALAIPLAWLTARTDLPGRRWWTIATALPLAIPSYVGSFAMIGALGPRGMVQGWLEPLGVDRLPSIYGFGGAFTVLTLFTFPYVLLPVRAAFRQLDPSLLEASRTLGAGPWGTFRRVVLAQIRPSVTAGALLVALYTLSDFGAVSMLRYDTFTRAIYTQYRGALNRNAAAVLGLALVAITVVVLAAEQRARQRQPTHRVHAGGGRLVPPTPLGRWRWPATAICALVTTVALVLPMAVIGYWLWRGARVGEPLLPAGDLVMNTLVASGLGAGLTMLAAWPVALMVVRHPGRFTRLVERLSWAGYALPGIVVALSLVFVGARHLPWLYQTLPMLVFAYAILFLPQAIGPLRGSLLQITPSMEDASHVLGASRVRTFWRITFPLARPGVTAGVALVFLTCAKELPATLLLAPTEFGTLATRVWTASTEAFFARAAAPALVLVLISAIPMMLVVRREIDRRDPEPRPPGQAGENATVIVPAAETLTRSPRATSGGPG